MLNADHYGWRKSLGHETSCVSSVAGDSITEVSESGPQYYFGARFRF